MATEVTRYHLALALAKARAFAEQNPFSAHEMGVSLLLWWVEESRRILEGALNDLRKTTDTDTAAMVAIRALLATYPGPGPGGKETP
jgi:hypothetical protein